ncbi:MAG: tetratricopeptide repeat protein [Acidimicrobiales bacterium]
MLTGLADAAVMQGRDPDAAALYGQALPIHREIGDRQGEANDLLGLGRTLARQGSSGASATFRDAARLYELLGRSDLPAMVGREADEAAAGDRPETS